MERRPHDSCGDRRLARPASAARRNLQIEGGARNPARVPHLFAAPFAAKVGDPTTKSTASIPSTLTILQLKRTPPRFQREGTKESVVPFLGKNI